MIRRYLRAVGEFVNHYGKVIPEGRYVGKVLPSRPGLLRVGPFSDSSDSIDTI
jgi:hypothetical protein